MQQETFSRRQLAIASKSLMRTSEAFYEDSTIRDWARIIYGIDKRHKAKGFIGVIPVVEIAYIANIKTLSKLSEALNGLKSKGLIAGREDNDGEVYWLTQFGEAAADFLEKGRPKDMSKVPGSYRKDYTSLYKILDEVAGRVRQLGKV